MKQKLLLITLSMLFFIANSQAQNKVWDFGNDATTWPLSSGIGINPIIVDNLGLFPIPTNTNFGAVNASGATFSDAYIAVNRFQLNGAGFSAGANIAIPTQRYLFMDVSGACTVKVWFKTGSNGNARTMYVSNGTAIVGSESTNTGSNADLAILIANYTGSAGRLYIYGGASCNLYKIEVNGATVSTTTLGVNDFDKISTKVHSFKNQVFISNVLTATEIKVYNILGGLVKELNTKSNTQFSIKAGIYFATIKTSEGQKSIKLLVE